MGLIVQKYGGTSVADATRILRVAERVAAAKKAGDQVVVVVSAMGDSTDDLIDLASQVSVLPAPLRVLRSDICSVSPSFNNFLISIPLGIT